MPKTIHTMLFICLSFTYHTGLAKQYVKIINPDGSIDYGDHIPAHQNDSRRSSLNDQGMTIESVGRALNKEEIEKLNTKEATEKRLKEAQALQAKKDKKLIDAYPSIEALILARDNNISSFQNKINLANSNIQKLHADLQAREKNAANIELSGKKVHKIELKAIKKLGKNIANNEYAIQEYRTQQNTIRKEFVVNLRTLQRILREIAERKAQRRRRR